MMMDTVEQRSHVFRRQRSLSVAVAIDRATSFPPPLRGRDREGGSDRALSGLKRRSTKKRVSDIGSVTSAMLVVPPSLSLPRRGGGNDVALTFTSPVLRSRVRQKIRGSLRA